MLIMLLCFVPFPIIAMAIVADRWIKSAPKNGLLRASMSLFPVNRDWRMH